MRALLDTHALLWWWKDDSALSPTARQTIAKASNEIFVSAASAWEIAIKQKSGRLSAPELVEQLSSQLEEEGFEALPISVDHALRAGLLIEHHKDPFDRMLIAQAQAENLLLVSNEEIFDRYGVRRIW